MKQRVCCKHCPLRSPRTMGIRSSRRKYWRCASCWISLFSDPRSKKQLEFHLRARGATFSGVVRRAVYIALDFSVVRGYVFVTEYLFWTISQDRRPRLHFMSSVGLVDLGEGPHTFTTRRLKRFHYSPALVQPPASAARTAWRVASSRACPGSYLPPGLDRSPPRPPLRSPLPP